MNNVMCLVDIAAGDPGINLVDHSSEDAETSVQNAQEGVNVRKEAVFFWCSNGIFPGHAYCPHMGDGT